MRGSPSYQLNFCTPSVSRSLRCVRLTLHVMIDAIFQGEGVAASDQEENERVTDPSRSVSGCGQRGMRRIGPNSVRGFSCVAVFVYADGYAAPLRDVQLSFDACGGCRFRMARA